MKKKLRVTEQREGNNNHGSGWVVQEINGSATYRQVLDQMGQHADGVVGHPLAD